MIVQSFLFVEKVLRNLMDRIKSQREEWMMTQSMVEVGEGEPQTLPHPQPTETGKPAATVVDKELSPRLYPTPNLQKQSL